MRKLTRTMKELLATIADGTWELGISTTVGGYTWVQEGGLGKGGASRTVNISTVLGLEDRKLIVRGKREYPTVPFAVTELGKEVATKLGPRD